MMITMKLPFTFALKFPFNRLIQNRNFVFGIYFLCLLPTLFMLFSILDKSERFREIKGEIDCLAIKMERVKELQKDRNTFFKTYKEADHYYVDHALESLQFLLPETEVLHLIMNSPAFDACDDIKRRLDLLTKGNNRLIFSEGNRKTGDQIEELELSQKRPVELNTYDLKRVLTAVEGISIGELGPPKGRPQVIMKRFHLNKKRLAERETYQLEMQLISRLCFKNLENS